MRNEHNELEGRTAHEMEMQSEAESNAPPQMLAEMREWDARTGE